MNRLILIFGLVLCLGLVGCKKEKPVTPQEQIAGRAAVQYYKYLQHRDFASFVDGTYFGKPIPTEYRKLLEKNAEQFVHDQDSLRHGMKSIKLSKADLMQNDTTLAAVYLLINYGDTTSEEVLVPMIKRKGVWYMK